VAGLVDETPAVDADPRLRGARRGGGEEDEGEREEERRGERPTDQTATRDGAGTRRENCIAPSSKEP
jgi:hypothetical protein